MWGRPVPEEISLRIKNIMARSADKTWSVDQIIEETQNIRQWLRENKYYDYADAIRKIMIASGIPVRDNPIKGKTNENRSSNGIIEDNSVNF